MKRWLLLALLPLVVSAGVPEAQEWVGHLTFVGNEPFVRLVLVDDEGRQWRLTGELVTELKTLTRGRRLVLTGQPSGKDAILVSSWAWAPEETKSDR